MWWTDDKETKHRLLLTTAVALGMMIAQAVVIPMALWMDDAK
jgi:hypothetical protein